MSDNKLDSKQYTTVESETISEAYEGGSRSGADTLLGEGSRKTSQSGALTTSQTAALIGRTEAARTLGVSTSTFIRHVEGKVLPAIANEKGWRLFRREEVLRIRSTVALPRVRRTKRDEAQPATTVDREVAVQVLEMLDAGKSIVEVARTLRLLPEELENLFQWWRTHHGALWLSGLDLAAIQEQLQSTGAKVATKAWKPLREAQRSPASTPKQIVDIVRDLCLFVETQALGARCAVCDRDQAQICGPCVRAAQRRQGKSE